MQSDTFRLIWEDLSNNLKKYIKKRVANPHDAEDVFQEVFLKINLNITDVKDITKLYAWVYQITKNTINDYYRKKSQEKKLFRITEEDLNIYENEPSKELIKCLKPMLEKLPEKYKEAILLTDLGELTQKELAMKLGLSVSGAKSRVQRGRAMLKEMFFECCQINFDNFGNIIDYNFKENGSKYC